MRDAKVWNEDPGWRKQVTEGAFLRALFCLTPSNFFLCFWKPLYQLFCFNMPSPPWWRKPWAAENLLLFDCFCQAFVVVKWYQLTHKRHTDHLLAWLYLIQNMALVQRANQFPLSCQCPPLSALKPGSEKVLEQGSISPKHYYHQLTEGEWGKGTNS